MKIIEIHCIGSRNLTIVHSVPERLKLFDTHCEIQWKLTTNESDNNTGIKKDVYYRGDKFIFKSAIVGVSAFYSHEEDYYKCVISCLNSELDYAFAFENMVGAVGLKDEIVKWLLA